VSPVVSRPAQPPAPPSDAPAAPADVDATGDDNAHDAPAHSPQHDASAPSDDVEPPLHSPTSVAARAVRARVPAGPPVPTRRGAPPPVPSRGMPPPSNGVGDHEPIAPDSATAVAAAADDDENRSTPRTGDSGPPVPPARRPTRQAALDGASATVRAPRRGQPRASRVCAVVCVRVICRACTCVCTAAPPMGIAAASSAIAGDLAAMSMTMPRRRTDTAPASPVPLSVNGAPPPVKARTVSLTRILSC
jgi:hypothetical protein